MLKGRLVGLRAVERSDLPILLEWRNRPELRQFFREFRELSMTQQQIWYEETVLRDKRTIMFAIQELSSGNLLGACGLCYVDWINHNADFSIYVGEGYIDERAIDAAIVMARYGFDELNLHRLWAEIYSEDKPKAAFFDKLGFRLEGVHKETHWTGGRWVDSHYYGILRDEFIEKFPR